MREKLLSCFAFEMVPVLTNNDPANSPSSSDENPWDKDVCPGTWKLARSSPLRPVGVCVCVHASEFGVGVIR